MERLFMRIRGTAAALLAPLAAAVPTPARPVSLGEMTQAAAGDLALVPQFISIMCYIAGAALVGLGLVRLKRHVDSPQQVTVGTGVIMLVVGTALILAPTVINAIAESAGVSSGSGTTLNRPTF